jgi:hypothetical protein
MKKCVHCGHMDGVGKFCPDCGVEQPPEPASPQIFTPTLKFRYSRTATLQQLHTLPDPSLPEGQRDVWLDIPWED